MSLYHILFLWLLLCTITEHLKGKTPKRLFAFSFIFLSLVLFFRFGQGQDYFSYAAIYHSIQPNLVAAMTNPNHSEPGWKFLCFLFRAADAPFPALIFIVSVYIMGMYWRFIRIYGGERKMLMLFLCFHTLYMTYFMSALRQAIVIATLLGVLLPLLMKRSYIKYFIVAILLTFIHSVALMVFLLPLIQNIDLKFKHCVALVVIGILLGIILSLIDFGVILQNVLSISYLEESAISIISLAERIATFCIVTFCYYTYLCGEEPDRQTPLFVIYKFYALGIFLYGILMWSPLISSRTGFLLKVIEVILICGCIVKCKRAKTLVLLYCILLCTVLYVKNIDSYLQQGQYQNATVIDYPYVTIFNQKDILNYRQDTFGYPLKW